MTHNLNPAQDCELKGSKHIQILIIPCTVWQNEHSVSAIKMSLFISFSLSISHKHTHTHIKKRWVLHFCHNKGFWVIFQNCNTSHPLTQPQAPFYLTTVSASIITTDPQTINYVFRQYYCNVHSDNKEQKLSRNRKFSRWHHITLTNKRPSRHLRHSINTHRNMKMH